MIYEKINMNSYNLHLIKTDKFKTVSVSVNFRRPVKKEEITIRKLLFSLLCYSSKKYNTNRLLKIELENLYLLNLVSNMQVIGNYIDSYVDIKFLNSNFSEKDIIIKSLSFLFEILFNPNTTNNIFDEKSVDTVKNMMKTTILSIKDNPALYSLIKVLEEMDSNNPVSYRSWGYIEDLENIKVEDIYNYYTSVIGTDLIDVFVIGDIDIIDIKNIFKDNFAVNTIKKKKSDIFIKYDSYRKRVKKVMLEEKGINQSKLSIVMKILNMSSFERKYVLPLYTDILGGASFSRLFQDVREKNSLAYSISASNKAPGSIIMISSGINKGNYSKALKIIKKNVKGMTQNIEDDELDKAQNDFITSVSSVLNNPEDIISHYLAVEIVESDSIDEKINNIKSVTKKDILKFAKKVKMDTVLLLYGDDKDEED